MGFLKGSQMLQQNCEHNKLYIFKNTAIDEINEYKQNRLPLETSSAKFSATTNFLFSLSSLHTLNKGILHDIKTTTTENKSNDP